MTYVIARADKVTSGHGISFRGKIALGIAALASGVAAGATYPASWVSDSTSSKDVDASSFDARFVSGTALLSTDFSRPLVQSLPADLEIKFQQAKERLSQKLQFQDRRIAVIEGAPPSPVAAVTLSNVPLPKSRPVEANLELRDSPPAAQPDNRTLLQKLSDLLPARVTLASLSP